MSEEKKTAAKQEPKKTTAPKKASWWKRFFAWCKRLPSRIAKPFKNMWYELKKVNWPSKKKLITCSVTILVFMVVFGLVIGFLDMGASALVRLLV